MFNGSVLKASGVFTSIVSPCLRDLDARELAAPIPPALLTLKDPLKPSLQEHNPAKNSMQRRWRGIAAVSRGSHLFNRRSAGPHLPQSEGAGPRGSGFVSWLQPLKLRAHIVSRLVSQLIC